MKTAGRSAAVRGSSTKQNVRYMQQPSWLQSASPYNVHSVHLLKEKVKNPFWEPVKAPAIFTTDVSEGEQNTHYFVNAKCERTAARKADWK